MIPLVIDLRETIDYFALTKSDVDNLIDSTIKYITAKYAEYWELAATRNLKSTRERYMNNLKVIDTGRMSGAVVLDYSKDPVVKFLEEGVGAFDIKLGFAKSAKKKIKKDGGWYMSIPFKYATPGAIGESSIFQGVMPLDIYKVVKKGSKAVKIQDIPEKFAIKTSRPAVTNLQTKKIFEEYKRKTNIFEGLKKQQNSTTGGSSYMTFRRVSDKSDEMSWIHSGINAYRLAEKAMDTLDSNFEQEMGKAIDSALIQMGFE